jgi:hypothetical protein
MKMFEAFSLKNFSSATARSALIKRFSGSTA